MNSPAGRAAGITGAGLLVGALLGGALQAWLRVDIVPVGVGFRCPVVIKLCCCVKEHPAVLHPT